MLDADDVSPPSSPPVPATESLLPRVTLMQNTDTMRSFLATHQRVSLLERKLLFPAPSSLVPLWPSSYPLLTSSLEVSLRQSLPSFIQPVQEATAFIRPALASRLLAETHGIGKMASAIAQMKTAVPPSISFFQTESLVLQNLFPSSKILEHLLSPMAFSQGMLTKDFLSSQRLLLQQVGAFSHQLNASLLSLTHWLPERLRQMGERLKLRLLAAFQRAKLCLAPSLSEDVIYQIMGYVEAGDLRPVTTSLWSYYARNRHARLCQAMNSWFDHPEFAARRHIFEEAFASHCDGRYIASIRMLTPEIEGLGSYTVREHNLRTVNKRGQDSGLRLGKTGSVVRRMVDAAEASDPGLLHWVRARSTHAYLDVFMADTDFESNYDRVRNNRSINRHGITHGFQIQGYAWLNSLRLFLLLDTIHYLL